MKLGMQVGLGSGHTVLDGDPAPPRKGAKPPAPLSKFNGTGVMSCMRVCRK